MPPQSCWKLSQQWRLHSSPPDIRIRLVRRYLEVIDHSTKPSVSHSQVHRIVRGVRRMIIGLRGVTVSGCKRNQIIKILRLKESPRILKTTPKLRMSLKRGLLRQSTDGPTTSIMGNCKSNTVHSSGCNSHTLDSEQSGIG